MVVLPLFLLAVPAVAAGDVSPLGALPWLGARWRWELQPHLGGVADHAGVLGAGDAISMFLVVSAFSSATVASCWRWCCRCRWCGRSRRSSSARSTATSPAAVVLRRTEDRLPMGVPIASRRCDDSAMVRRSSSWSRCARGGSAQPWPTTWRPQRVGDVRNGDPVPFTITSDPRAACRSTTARPRRGPTSGGLAVLRPHAGPHARRRPTLSSIHPPYKTSWSKVGGGLLEYPPTYANGVLYERSDAGTVTAYNVFNGKRAVAKAPACGARPRPPSAPGHRRQCTSHARRLGAGRAAPRDGSRRAGRSASGHSRAHRRCGTAACTSASSRGDGGRSAQTGRAAVAVHGVGRRQAGPGGGGRPALLR